MMFLPPGGMGSVFRDALGLVLSEELDQVSVISLWLGTILPGVWFIVVY